MMAALWDLLCALLWIGLGVVVGVVGFYAYLLSLFARSGGRR